MAERDLILKEEIEYEGFFDFPAFYSFAHSWLKNEGYGVSEDRYSEKVSGEQRKIDIGWKATKKLSDYFKAEIKIEFGISELTEVQVEIDGKRQKMNKGGINVNISLALVKDPESKWETTPFNRFLRDVYNKFIIPGRINSIEGILKSKTIEFKENMKTFLEINAKR